jgi:hypothetical protein
VFTIESQALTALPYTYACMHRCIGYHLAKYVYAFSASDTILREGKIIGRIGLCLRGAYKPVHCWCTDLKEIDFVLMSG